MEGEGWRRVEKGGGGPSRAVPASRLMRPSGGKWSIERFYLFVFWWMRRNHLKNIATNTGIPRLFAQPMSAILLAY